jgi:hypothetical protein
MFNEKEIDPIVDFLKLIIRTDAKKGTKHRARTFLMQFFGGGIFYTCFSAFITTLLKQSVVVIYHYYLK